MSYEGVICVYTLNVYAHEQPQEVQDSIRAAVNGLGARTKTWVMVDAVAGVLGISGAELWRLVQARQDPNRLPFLPHAAEDPIDVIEPSV